MFKLAYKLLISRRKWFLIMTCSLALMISVISSIHIASESIKNSLLKNAYSEYGQHTGALIGVDESLDTLLKKTDRVGQYHIETTITINEDILATVGWMDPAAIDIGSIEFIDGSYPKSENEVAIEEIYVKLIDENWNIGEQRVLQFEETEKLVTLTGIIQNYSSKWSAPFDVEKGVNDFPNVFTPINNTEVRLSGNNFLFLFEGKMDSVEQETYELLEQYIGAGYDTFFNDGLYYKGLIDYRTISSLSIAFQIVCLIVALFSALHLFFNFNINQSKKFATMKATGATNEELYKIGFYQCIIVLLIGLVLSIPLQLFLYTLIIKNTYQQSVFDLSSLVFVVIPLVVIFGVHLFSSFLSIRELEHKNINAVLKGVSTNDNNYLPFTENINNFKLKQIINQILVRPKQLISTVIVLCIAILTLNFSIFLQKESTGIWDTQQDYYITTQSAYTYDVIDGLTVLTRQGAVIKPNMIEKLESLEGIRYVEKKPSMMDVHPSINSEVITPSLQFWKNQFDPSVSTYNGDVLIPNTNYILVDEKEFESIYNDYEYTDFTDKVIIHNHISIEGIETESRFKGEEINFIKKFYDHNSLETREWTFEVLEFYNSPFNVSVDDSLTIEEEYELTFVLNEETAINSGLLPGYKDLAIYLEQDISMENREKIESFLYEMTATIPGSMFQNISEFMVEDTKISELVGYYGKLAFVISIILSLITLIIIIFTKYKTQKKKWGVFLALGFTKKKVLQALQIELIAYLIIATVIGFGLYFFSLLIIDHFFPTYEYLLYYAVSVLLLFVCFIFGSMFLKSLIEEESIYSMVRVEE